MNDEMVVAYLELVDEIASLEAKAEAMREKMSPEQIEAVCEQLKSDADGTMRHALALKRETEELLRSGELIL